MCVFLVLLLTGPRMGIIFWWLIQPGRWNNAFDSIIVPLFGWLFLPWTTLMFVAVAPHGNVADADWIWLAFALFIDLSSIAFGGRSRGQVPGFA